MIGVERGRETDVLLRNSCILPYLDLELERQADEVGNVVGADGEEGTVMIGSQRPCWVCALWKVVVMGQDGNVARPRLVKL